MARQPDLVLLSASGKRALFAVARIDENSHRLLFPASEVEYEREAVSGAFIPDMYMSSGDLAFISQSLVITHTGMQHLTLVRAPSDENRVIVLFRGSGGISVELTPEESSVEVAAAIIAACARYHETL